MQTVVGIQKYLLLRDICGLYYKHITIVNYNSSAVKRFGASLTDDARGVNYDRHMFIVQATGGQISNLCVKVGQFLRLSYLSDMCLSSKIKFYFLQEKM